jgi:hypothetical protein
MNSLIILAAISVAVVLWYALGGLAWLKSKPRAQKFFAAVEPFEIAQYKKSETILLARLKMLLGATLAVLTSLGQIDLTPIMLFVPAERQDVVRALFNLLPLIITLVGLMDGRLRRRTTKPIELVAIRRNPRHRFHRGKAISGSAPPAGG